MEASIKFSDIAIIIATLMGPIFAVQIQKWLERKRDSANRQHAIFRVLMSTRQNGLSQNRVEALNSIPIEFWGSRKSLKNVLRSWKIYMDHLNRGDASVEIWAPRNRELFIDLLFEISVHLRYEFDKVQLQREVYSPVGHAQNEERFETIQNQLLKLLTGQIALPMEVKAITPDPVLRAKDNTIRDLLIDWLNVQMQSNEQKERSKAGEPVERRSEPRRLTKGSD